MAQFNRIAAQEGFGPPGGIVIVRRGVCFDYDPNASKPAKFEYVVGQPDAPHENFGQALHVLHNPNANVPLPDGAFPGLVEQRLEGNGQIATTCSGFLPFASVTEIYTSKD